MENILDLFAIVYPSVFLKAGIFLGISCLFAFSLRKISAQIRHTFWTSTFIILLIIPLGMHTLPSWNITWDMNREESSLSAPQTIQVDNREATIPSYVDVSTFVNSSSDTVLNIKHLLFLLWSIGTLITLSLIGFGFIQYQSLLKKSSRLNCFRTENTLSEISERLAVHRNVELLESNYISSPLTGGYVNPKIILPSSSESWGDDMLNSVLTHELIHVKRHDPLRHLVARLSLAIHWFNPTAWIANRMAIESREEACDDAVVQSGITATNYAKHIMSLSDGRNAERPKLAIALMPQTNLEKRIRSIVRTKRPELRPILSKLVSSLVVIGGLILTTASRESPEISSVGMTKEASTLELEPFYITVVFGNNVDQKTLDLIQSQFAQNGVTITFIDKVYKNDKLVKLAWKIEHSPNSKGGSSISTEWADGEYEFRWVLIYHSSGKSLVSSDPIPVLEIMDRSMPGSIQYYPNRSIVVTQRDQAYHFFDRELKKENIDLSTAGRSNSEIVADFDARMEKSLWRRAENVIYESQDSGLTYKASLVAGMAQVFAKLNYPQDAKDKGEKGKVLLSILVGSDGRVKDVELKEGVSPSLDEEALRVGRTLTFRPASKGGKFVESRVLIPINFRLGYSYQVESSLPDSFLVAVIEPPLTINEMELIRNVSSQWELDVEFSQAESNSVDGPIAEISVNVKKGKGSGTKIGNLKPRDDPNRRVGFLYDKKTGALFMGNLADSEPIQNHFRFKSNDFLLINGLLESPATVVKGLGNLF